MKTLDNMRVALVSLLLLGAVFADPEVYFEERFDTGTYVTRLCFSTHQLAYFVN